MTKTDPWGLSPDVVVTGRCCGEGPDRERCDKNQNNIGADFALFFSRLVAAASEAVEMVICVLPPLGLGGAAKGYTPSGGFGLTGPVLINPRNGQASLRAGLGAGIGLAAGVTAAQAPRGLADALRAAASTNRSEKPPASVDIRIGTAGQAIIGGSVSVPVFVFSDDKSKHFPVTSVSGLFQNLNLQGRLGPAAGVNANVSINATFSTPQVYKLECGPLQ